MLVLSLWATPTLHWKLGRTAPFQRRQLLRTAQFAIVPLFKGMRHRQGYLGRLLIKPAVRPRSPRCRRRCRRGRCGAVSMRMGDTHNRGAPFQLRHAASNGRSRCAT
mmetsp:Transcript_6919/g.21665  ORF Transcript_6919/g.21665 Transcript_6919/m.21665 type:complete len:107 (+) Transcript_6919:458-778(+)